MKTALEPPWGQAQSVKRIAEGIDFVETASHGGYRLSPAYQQRLSDLVPAFRTYAGGPWYEEDCDASGLVGEILSAEREDA